MLTLRARQMQALGEAAHELFIAAMCTHARTYFPATAWLLTDAELDDQVRACIGRAMTYGLRSQRDTCRFLNLAAQCGWEFDTDPALRWMRRCLDDESVSNPSNRLQLLVRRCLQEQAVLVRNERLRREFNADVRISGESHEADPGTDYPGSSGTAVVATRQHRSQPGIQLFQNRRAGSSRHPSNDHATPAPHRPLPWVDEASPLLKPRKGSLHE